MQESADIRSKQSIQRLLDQVLPKLAAQIHENLAEIIPLFHDFSLEIVVDTWTRNPDEEAGTEISIQNGNVQQVGLKLKLDGFQSAGATPFDIIKDLIFKLGYMAYEVRSGKNNILAEKNYSEPWSEKELKEIAKIWSEELIDEITQRLESQS